MPSRCLTLGTSAGLRLSPTSAWPSHSIARATLVLRMPDELLDWVREKAALETIRRKAQFSMNTLVVEILSAAKEADQKKGGIGHETD